MKLNSSDNATVVTVVQTLKWLRNIWTEREEKFKKNEICEIVNSNSSPPFTVCFYANVNNLG